MARKPATELTDEQKAAAKAAREAEKLSKFERLAEKRVSKAVDAMAALRGLANKNTYSFTEKHVEVMFGALEKELETLQGLFAPNAEKPVATGGLFDIIKSGE